MRRGRDRGDPYRAPSAPSDRPCPRCAEPAFLRPDTVGETPVDRCSRCDGVWVSLRSFRHVREDIERQSEIVALLGPGEPFLEERIVYLRCPQCTGPMARTNFGRRSGVIVDSCPAHGIWFDPGELVAAIEFLITRSAQRPQEESARAAPPQARPLGKPMPLESTEPAPARWISLAIEAIGDLLFWP